MEAMASPSTQVAIGEPSISSPAAGPRRQLQVQQGCMQPRAASRPRPVHHPHRCRPRRAKQRRKAAAQAVCAELQCRGELAVAIREQLQRGRQRACREPVLAQASPVRSSCPNQGPHINNPVTGPESLKLQTKGM